MKKSPIVITTISLIRTKEEEKVVIEAVKALSKLGVPIIISDGGSTNRQKEAIRKLPNITLYEVKGHTNQLVNSFQKGAEIADALFYLHTDKLDFVQKHASNAIKYYLNCPKNTMLVIARDKPSLKAYPKYQQETEKFLNFMISDYIGIKADYYYGPKIIPSKLVSYLSQLNKDIKWGIEAFFYTIHYRLSLPLDFYKVDIKPPKEILDSFAFQKYRLNLIKWQIDGLIQGQKVKL